MTRMGTLEDGDVRTMMELRQGGDPRTIPEMKAADEWQEGPITEVTPYGEGDGWSVSFREEMTSKGPATYPGTMGLGVPKFDGKPEPKVGDTLRVYGGGFGSTFHGIDINSVEVFWRTPWERMAKRVQWLADYDRRKREHFAAEKDELDRKFDALPDPLKRRIERFRGEDPAFRVESEAYELVACVDGAKIAAHLRYEVDAGADPGEAVKRFYDLGWERQKELVPDLDEGHSGNTFGGACRLALALLRGDEC